MFEFSCFASVELTTVLLFGQIQTSQTGGQPFRDASPYGEWFLGHPTTFRNFEYSAHLNLTIILDGIFLLFSGTFEG